MAAVPEGFRYLPGYVDAEVQAALIAALRALAEAAPLYRPTMPKSGRPFSVRMTNAGSHGWFSDREGYRYIRRHPESGRPWRSEEHTSELQSLMRHTYAVFCLKKKTKSYTPTQ